jgi:hypothetical protein
MAVNVHQSRAHTWGMGNTTLEAALSVAVVALFAAAFTAIAIRTFAGSALR